MKVTLVLGVSSGVAVVGGVLNGTMYIRGISVDISDVSETD